MGTVKVTRNYQITIPKDIRKKLGIEVGDVLRVEVEGDRVLLKKGDVELPVFKGGKGLSAEDIEERIERGMKETLTNGGD
jgi:AbrB family looped-hinge helix DNA binding protein